MESTCVCLSVCAKLKSLLAKDCTIIQPVKSDLMSVSATMSASASSFQTGLFWAASLVSSSSMSKNVRPSVIFQ